MTGGRQKIMAGDVVVFAGPTLSAEEVRSELEDARVLPPVSQADVYSVARFLPWAIGIVDGYFERVPAVWHKEILWAMSRGIHVFGSASMGALRAAELERYGMVGVGEIFRAFRDGVLEDDDEVAVVHGPSASGFLALSDAMVDLRRTFARAHEEGVISEAARFQLVETAKGLFYAERTFPRVLELASDHPATRDACVALGDWLPEGKVRQKRDDALAMLREIRRLRAADPAPKSVKYTFQHTTMWEALRQQGERIALSEGLDANAHLPDLALEELRLGADAYPPLRERALSRVLAVAVAESRGLQTHSTSAGGAESSFRDDLGLAEAPAFEGWLDKQQLDRKTLARLLATSRIEESVRSQARSVVESTLRDLLRLEGRYGELVDRGRRKQQILTERGLDNPSLADAGLEDEELWRWYFHTRLGRRRPEDLADHVRRLDFRDVDSLRRAVLREYLYLRSERGEDGEVKGQ